MKTIRPRFASLLLPFCFFCAHVGNGQVPGVISYQGQVKVGGTNFSGVGRFKFALVDAGSNTVRRATASAIVNSGFITGINVVDGGTGYASAPPVIITDASGAGAVATANFSGGAVASITVQNAGSGYSANPSVTIGPPAPNIVFRTLWSNDDTSAAGSEPTAAILAPVSSGLFTVLLGDTNLPNMTVIPASVFANQDVHLRIWFNDGLQGFAQLAPDQPVVSVGYAMRAEVASNVSSNSVGANELKNGTITANKLAPGVIPSALPPNGAAGGDLAGSYPNPTIAANAVSGSKIANQGVDFTKISQVGAAAGEVLNFDGNTVGWRQDSLRLPFSGFTVGTPSGFEIIDTNGFSASGSSPLLRLDIRDTNTGRTAFRLTTGAHGANGIEASTTGGGSVAVFSKNIDRATGGGTFIGPVLVAEARAGSHVTAAEFNALDTNNTRVAVDIEHRGTGVALQVDATGLNIATFRRRTVNTNGSSTTTVVRFDSTGKGFFDGGTQTGGADVAEAFDVEGDRASYQAGDVLVISTSRSRQMVQSSDPYSTLVAGVVATKPGVLLTEQTNEADLSEQIPMGVIGVLPTKVCDRNGPIHIGDLLVTSSIRGHAMKGDTVIIKERPGCILGKALESFDGNGNGVIRVLVSVR